MTSRDFAFWLQGFFEIANPEEITKDQIEMIKKHLNLVFYHEIDPGYTSDPKKQEDMNKIHSDGFKPPQPAFKPSPNNNGIFPKEDDIILRC